MNRPVATPSLPPSLIHYLEIDSMMSIAVTVSSERRDQWRTHSLSCQFGAEEKEKNTPREDSNNNTTHARTSKIKNPTRATSQRARKRDRVTRVSQSFTLSQSNCKLLLPTRTKWSSLLPSLPLSLVPLPSLRNPWPVPRLLSSANPPRSEFLFSRRPSPSSRRLWTESDTFVLVLTF